MRTLMLTVVIPFMFLVAIATPFLARRMKAGWTRRFVILAAASAGVFIVSAVLHNVVGALFDVEEPVFFLLAVIGAPVGVLVGLIGAAVSAIVSNRPPGSTLRHP